MTASYALAEIPNDRQISVVTALWAACDGVLVLVEPGTPAGYARILAARAALIAAGPEVVGRLLEPAPDRDVAFAGCQAWNGPANTDVRGEVDDQWGLGCPHEAGCPLVGDDWCHFSVRLARSRDHRLAKGAEVPFEDERFAYLVAARPGIAVAPRQPRVLAPPRTGKPGIALKLCGLDGRVENRLVAKRDKPSYAVARRLDWGDTL